MQIKIKLHGPLRIKGHNEQIIQSPEGGNVQQLADVLLIEEMRIGIVVRNGQVTELTRPLTDGDEISFFPLVSGG